MSSADLQNMEPTKEQEDERNSSTEASMEDILASIRQIIADESEEISAAPEAVDESEHEALSHIELPPVPQSPSFPQHTPAFNTVSDNVDMEIALNMAGNGAEQTEAPMVPDVKPDIKQEVDPELTQETLIKAPTQVELPAAKKTKVSNDLSKVLFDSLKGKLDNIKISEPKRAAKPVAEPEVERAVESVVEPAVEPAVEPLSTKAPAPEVQPVPEVERAVEPMSEPASDVREQVSEDSGDVLLSSKASKSIENAFQTLAEAKINKRLDRIEADLEAKIDNALEPQINALLKPMLKTWLDENLPQMVERIVEREIKRITDG